MFLNVTLTPIMYHLNQNNLIIEKNIMNNIYLTQTVSHFMQAVQMVSDMPHQH